MEMILALPAEKLAPYLTHDGLIRGCEQELTALVEEEHCFQRLLLKALAKRQM